MGRIVSLVAVVGMLLLVSACGGGEPVSLSDIPVPPEATPMEAGQSTMADTFLETVSSTVGETMTTDANLYTLPADTTWQQVQDFYATELAETDWQAAEELSQESEAINVTGWSRGGFASEQVLMVSQGSDPLSGDTFLIVGLFSE